MAKANDKYVGLDAIQMKESFEVEKTIKVQEEEMTDLENNYKLLKNTFEENRKKNQAEWENQVETGNRRRNQEKQALQKKISESNKKVNHMKQFKVLTFPSQKRQEEYWEQLRKLRQKQQQNKCQQERDIDKIRQEHEGKRKDLKENIDKEIDSIKELEVNKIEQSTIDLMFRDE